jgi:hypothetical protein
MTNNLSVPRHSGGLSSLRSILEGTRSVAGMVASPAHAPLFVQCLSLICYFAAARLMMLDPWFTGESFAWKQSSILVLLGFLMVMAAAFEWHLLGVSRGFNLVVQASLAYPFMVFLARLMGRPWNYTGNTSPLGLAVSLATRAVDSFTGLSAMIPTWILDAFSSPGTTLILLFFCIVTTFCSTTPMRIAGVATMLLVSLAVVFSQPSPPSTWFILGALVMGAGAAMQYRDVGKYYRDRAILQRLRRLTDECARRAALRLVTRAWEDGRLGEATAEGLVREAYRDVPGADDRVVHDATRALVQDLVTTYGLLDIRHNAEGIFLVPPSEAELENDILDQAARFPRLLIVFLLALAWVCMPIDMIPDAVPIFGAVDDVVMMSLATTPLGQILGRRVQARRLAKA